MYLNKKKITLYINNDKRVNEPFTKYIMLCNRNCMSKVTMKVSQLDIILTFDLRDFYEHVFKYISFEFHSLLRSGQCYTRSAFQFNHGEKDKARIDHANLIVSCRPAQQSIPIKFDSRYYS